MERYLLIHPPRRQIMPEAVIRFDSLPVSRFDEKYLHFRSDLLWGDLVQYKRVNSVRIGDTVIVKYKVNSSHRVWTTTPSYSHEIFADWAYLMAEEKWGIPVDLVQLTVLARRRVHCEHPYLT